MREFATIEDLEDRFRLMDAGEADRAATRLMDASAMLETLLVKRGVRIDPYDELQENELRRVTCEIVARSMMDAANDVAWGGAEPLQKYKGLRIYESDIRLLCPRCRIGSVPLV